MVLQQDVAIIVRRHQTIAADKNINSNT